MNRFWAFQISHKTAVNSPISSLVRHVLVALKQSAGVHYDRLNLLWFVSLDPVLIGKRINKISSPPHYGSATKCWSHRILGSLSEPIATIIFLHASSIHEYYQEFPSFGLFHVLVQVGPPARKPPNLHCQSVPHSNVVTLMNTSQFSLASCLPNAGQKQPSKLMI